MERRQKKPFIVAGVLTILYVAEIFWLSDVFGSNFGLLGTVLHEVVLAFIGIAVFICVRGKLKKIFPFKKPELKKLAGTVILWLGAYIGTMVITMIIVYFFPEEVMGVSQDIQDVIMEVPVLVSLLVVAVTPAICEEIAFRGALLSCFRGIKNRWGGIIIVAAIFGACHGSIWRLVPTMLLGIAMGYLLFETENMIYPMLFHFINNAVPVIMLAVMDGLLSASGMGDMSAMAISGATEVLFATVAIYLMYSGIAPLLLYVANYLLHSGQEGYDQGLFPREKRKTMIVLIVVAVGMFLFGAVLAGISIAFDPIFYLY